MIEKSLATSFETTERYEVIDDRTIDTSTLADKGYKDKVSITQSDYTEKFDGWFKAPASGKFRFFMSCDDKCRLEFDSAHPYGSGTAPNMQTILEVSSWMSFRRYQTRASWSYSETTMNSSWITLSEGKYYRIRGLHG